MNLEESRWRLRKQNLNDQFKPIQGMDLGGLEEVEVTTLVVVDLMEDTLREPMAVWVVEAMVAHTGLEE
jgi:hypothetical protein